METVDLNQQFPGMVLYREYLENSIFYGIIQTVNNISSGKCDTL
jgi:hypothetical protein